MTQRAIRALEWNERFDVEAKDPTSQKIVDLDEARRWRQEIEEKLAEVELRLARLEAQRELRILAENGE